MTVDQIIGTTAGRIARADYWKALLLVTLLVALSAAAFRIPDGTICTMQPGEGSGTAYFVALGFAVAVIGWMGFAYVVRRLHDVGLPGWLALFVVAPYVAVPLVMRIVICPLAAMELDGVIAEIARLTPMLTLGGLALLALALQLYLGLQPGHSRPNRYGPPPGTAPGATPQTASRPEPATRPAAPASRD